MNIKMNNLSDKQLEEKKVIERCNTEPGIHVGKIFHVRVADGKAFYKITKVRNKHCNVEWINFPHLNPDKYICPVISLKGKVSKEFLVLFFGMNKTNDIRLDMIERK